MVLNENNLNDNENTIKTEEKVHKDNMIKVCD